MTRSNRWILTVLCACVAVFVMARFFGLGRSKAQDAPRERDRGRGRGGEVAEAPKDGRRVLFSSNRDGDGDGLYVLDIETRSVRRLSTGAGFHHSGSQAWAPDGSRIVFARDKTYVWGGLAANWEPGGVICVINADGTNERQLTTDEVFAFHPHFSADGRSAIYFTADGETLSKDSLTVRVGLKESGPPRPLCYCFGYTFEDIERDARRAYDAGKEIVRQHQAALRINQRRVTWER